MNRKLVGLFVLFLVLLLPKQESMGETLNKQLEYLEKGGIGYLHKSIKGTILATSGIRYKSIGWKIQLDTPSHSYTTLVKATPVLFYPLGQPYGSPLMQDYELNLPFIPIQQPTSYQWNRSIWDNFMLEYPDLSSRADITHILEEGGKVQIDAIMTVLMDGKEEGEIQDHVQWRSPEKYKGEVYDKKKSMINAQTWGSMTQKDLEEKYFGLTATFRGQEKLKEIEAQAKESIYKYQAEKKTSQEEIIQLELEKTKKENISSEKEVTKGEAISYLLEIVTPERFHFTRYQFDHALPNRYREYRNLVAHAVEQKVLQQGEIKSMSDLNQGITRMEMATYLIRLLNLEVPPMHHPYYVDVFNPFLDLMYEYGLMDGINTDVGMAFRPNQIMSLQEIQQVLERTKAFLKDPEGFKQKQQEKLNAFVMEDLHEWNWQDFLQIVVVNNLLYVGLFLLLTPVYVWMIHQI